MKIPPTLKRQINWTSLGSAFKPIPKNKQKEVLKWHSGFCGTRRKQAKSAECPGRHFPFESTDHILKCSAAGATKLWNDEMAQLHKWLLSNNAAPELAEAIINGLQSWRNNHPPGNKTYLLPHLNAAITTQSQIHAYAPKYWKQKFYYRFYHDRMETTYSTK